MQMNAVSACRQESRYRTTAAAAVIRHENNGGYQIWARRLADDPEPNSSRAALTAIIIALEQSLEFYEELGTKPFVNVVIKTDSEYALMCMTGGLRRWLSNGWVDAGGVKVKNRDLLGRALDVQMKIEENGTVQYMPLPFRDELAERAVYAALDYD
ncbi:MAG: hypothetical protein Q9170_008082 [Blastenia crenularia]